MTPLVFAFGAGLLSTVNPCGFALLPSFLAFYVGGEGDDIRLGALDRLVQGMAVGLAVSAGFAGVFVLAGALLSEGLRSVLGALPWAVVAVGAMLVLLGVGMIAGRHVGLTIPVALSGTRQRGYRRAVLFGGAYALASLSCTVAVLLAVVAQALATRSLPLLVGVFAAYASGAATILVALSISAAFARGALSRWVRRLLPVVGRLAGGFLVLSGAYLIAYWLPQALHPGSLAPSSLTGFAAGISGRLTEFVGSVEGALAAIGAVLLVGGVGLAMVVRRRSPRHSGDVRDDGVSRGTMLG